MFEKLMERFKEIIKEYGFDIRELHINNDPAHSYDNEIIFKKDNNTYKVTLEAIKDEAI